MTTWHPRPLARSAPPEVLLRRLLRGLPREEQWPRHGLYREPPDVTLLETDGNPPMTARWSRASKLSPIQFSENADERFRDLARETRSKGN